MGEMKSTMRVFVAMSGGVDSAVTAAKLINRGYRVTGIYMDTWKDPKWESQSGEFPKAAELAKDVAAFLEIPFVLLDVRERFYQNVVLGFIQKYLQSQTPNPCLFCNPQVKWGVLQTYALEHSGDFFATGHYAKIDRLDSGKVRLKRGVDETKDQSYVLCMLSQFQLQKSLLPLGEMTKSDVRAEAQMLGLPVANRQDSQDLCFLGAIDYRDFLQRFAPESSTPGDIVTVEGKVVGKHQGLPFYTMGQRKGIRVAAEESYYVVGKKLETNQLIVGFAEQAGKQTLIATQPNWISEEPPEIGKTYEVMIRYRVKPEPAILTSVGKDRFGLEFKRTVRGITPGQVVALYHEEICFGGGVIVSAE
jgi:tRNA-uridine 2-sulfurtransferase